MDKRFFLCEENLVLLKRQMGQIFQYSFKARIWDTVPELKGIEDHPELFTEVTEEEANNYIEAVEKMIENIKHSKTK